MRLGDIFRLSINEIAQKGLRSWLTIIGIVIGVGAVIAIVSIGAGMEADITNQLSSLGGDLIIIQPGSPSGEETLAATFAGGGSGLYLTDKDLGAINTVPRVKAASGIVVGAVKASYFTESYDMMMQGIDSSTWNEITTVELAEGRFLSFGDKYSVVIGSKIAKEQFDKELVLNSQLKIEGKSFKIVGILEESGGFSMYAEDNMIFMPIDVARDFEGVPSDSFSNIQVRALDVDFVDAVEEAIDQKLMLVRHVSERDKDFNIISQKSIQEQVSQILAGVSIFLVGIAAISLLVGAVGIANTMFTSVMEKTKEIGILKALGSSDGEIMKIFLFQAGIIGLVGGLIGVFLGYIAAGLVGQMSYMTGVGPRQMTTIVSPSLVFFVLGFSFVIGLISGIIPAKRAAKLPPNEALRYE